MGAVKINGTWVNPDLVVALDVQLDAQLDVQETMADVTAVGRVRARTAAGGMLYLASARSRGGSTDQPYDEEAHRRLVKSVEAAAEKELDLIAEQLWE